MKYGNVTLNVLVRELIDDYAMDTKEVPESLIKRWAMDAKMMVPTTEELAHHVTHLVVQGGKAILPDNFKHVQAILGRVEREGCRTKRVEKLVQWTVPTSDTDVSLEVRVICNKCKKRECTCQAPIIEVDVDRVWEMGHPEVYMKRFTSKGDWGNGAGPSDELTDWTMLRPMKGHFSNAYHFVTDCPNMQVPYEAPSFYLDLPVLNTSFMDGEIMLSYLGSKLGPDGDITIPDNVDLLEGIKNHVMFKWFTRMYTRSIGAKTEASQQYLQASRLHKSDREESFGIYRSAAIQPDPIEFRDFMRNVWLRRLPDPHYDTNLGVAPRKGKNAQYRDIFKF